MTLNGDIRVCGGVVDSAVLCLADSVLLVCDHSHRYMSTGCDRLTRRTLFRDRKSETCLKTIVNVSSNSG